MFIKINIKPIATNIIPNIISFEETVLSFFISKQFFIHLKENINIITGKNEARKIYIT